MWSWREARSGIAVGLVGGLVGGLLGELVVGLSTNQLDERMRLTPNQGIWRSARNGLLFGLLGGLRPFLQHFTLRFWLWRTGSLPWNLIAFLDEAAERLLLRKVGGGYIFVHRLLLEYFASLDATPSLDEANAQTQQAQRVP